MGGYADTNFRLPGIQSIRDRARQSEQKFPKCWDDGEVVVTIRQLKNPNDLLESFDISERTSNTFTKFRRGFLWNFVQNFRTPGI